MSAASIVENLHKTSDPTSPKDAFTRSDASDWIRAAEAEVESLLKNRSWRPATELEKSKQKAIPSKMIFTAKLDAEGRIKKHKARLVAGGHRQQENIDYEETFAPTVRLETVRTVLAVTAAEDMELGQSDIKTAFLEAGIDSTILMKLPNFDPDLIGESKILMQMNGQIVILTGNLYGLKQGGKMWYEEIRDYMISLGFIVSPHDPALYYRKESLEKGKAIWVAIYVDDLIMASKLKSTIEFFRAELRKRFTLSDDDEIHHILGMKIQRDRKNKTIHLSQPAKIAELVVEAKMTNAEPNDCPFFPPSVPKDEELFSNVPVYLSLVGKTVWISRCTRPDITIQVSKLSKRLGKPTLGDWKNLKVLIRYLKGTLEQGITLGGTTTMIGYSDANYINLDDEKRRSTSGFIFIIGGPISWGSKIQGIIALSSTEAEYVALCLTMRECVWLIGIYNFIRRTEETTITIRCDNQSAMKLGKNPVYHARTKHIDVKYHWIREAIENKICEIEYVHTQKQLADILTKQMPKRSHKALRLLIGVQ